MKLLIEFGYCVFSSFVLVGMLFLVSLSGNDITAGLAWFITVAICYPVVLCKGANFVHDLISE